MSDQRIAYRYAKALLELAEEQKVTDAICEDMRLFTSVCEANRDLRLMLRNPVITHDRKLKILKTIFGDKVHSITNSYIDIITRKNRENILEATATEFVHLYNIKKGIGEASVTTTFKLDSAMKGEFEKVVKKIIGKKVLLKEKVDNEIIGGFVLKIEDRQIDESIRSKLKELEYKFGENPYVGKL